MPEETSQPVDLQALVRDMNEALVLAAVRDRPKHGYQVALDIGERSGGLFSFQHGTLYPILHRLEKAGLLSGAWSDGTGRRRKEYRITPAGRERLEAEGERTTRILEVLRRLLDPEGDA